MPVRYKYYEYSIEKRQLLTEFATRYRVIIKIHETDETYGKTYTYGREESIPEANITTKIARDIPNIIREKAPHVFLALWAESLDSTGDSKDHYCIPYGQEDIHVYFNGHTSMWEIAYEDIKIPMPCVSSQVSDHVSFALSVLRTIEAYYDRS